MERSGFRGREDTDRLIQTLENLEVREGDDFPHGDKLVRKQDHQTFCRELIFEVRNSAYNLVEVVPKERTLHPAACRFV